MEKKLYFVPTVELTEQFPEIQIFLWRIGLIKNIINNQRWI
jgi:hypothetical protein